LKKSSSIKFLYNEKILEEILLKKSINSAFRAILPQTSKQIGQKTLSASELSEKQKTIEDGGKYLPVFPMPMML